VLGRVSLWGEVVECERGYRASHAYPAALYVPLDATCRGGPAAETVARELAAYDATIESIPARWRDAPAVLTSGALRNWS
jgi:hypothetical protein